MSFNVLHWKKGREQKPPPFPFEQFKYVNWDAARAHVSQFEEQVRDAIRTALHDTWAVIVEPPAFEVPGIEIMLWRRPALKSSRKTIRLPSGILCCAEITREELNHVAAELRAITRPLAKHNLKLLLLLPAETGWQKEKLIFRVCIDDYRMFLPARSKSHAGAETHAKT